MQKTEKKLSEHQKKIIVRLIIAVIIYCLGFCTYYLIFNAKTLDGKIINTNEKVIDTRMLKSELVKSSELTTAKLKLSCICEFKDKGIMLLNRSDFVMLYDANIRAGIDMNMVEIPEDKIDYENKIIYVVVPKATILDKPAIEPSTIKYYDSKMSLFNVNEKEDANKAQELAQTQAEEKAIESGILELADSQSETLIKGILSNAISILGYSIEIIKAQ